MTPANAAPVDRAEVDGLLVTGGGNLRRVRQSARVCLRPGLPRRKRMASLIVLSRPAYTLGTSVSAMTKGSSRHFAKPVPRKCSR